MSTFEEIQDNLNCSKVNHPTLLRGRFQQVMVEAPSVEDTVSILRGLKERYEVHHKVSHHKWLRVTFEAKSDI